MSHSAVKHACRFRGEPARGRLSERRSPRLGAALGVVALGCAGAPPPSERTEPTVASERADSPADRAWAVVELTSVPALLTLFDAGGWRRSTVGSFVVLEHAGTRSTLVLRSWRAARLVRAETCEADARLARPSLPRLDPDGLVERRPLEAPSGFGGWLTVAVEPAAESSTRGAALAVGAAVGRCFVAAFETLASDAPGSAEVVAGRLRLAADRVFPSIRLPGVDDRVRPEFELK